MTRKLFSRILDTYVRSDHFANYQSEYLDSCAYSRDDDERDRYSRCLDAAEDGADGSTHREHLSDMRHGFLSYLETRRTYAEYPHRVEAHVLAEIDAIEDWHVANGSIDESIG
jgi:hypothetical protein